MCVKCKITLHIIHTACNVCKTYSLICVICDSPVACECLLYLGDSYDRIAAAMHVLQMQEFGQVQLLPQPSFYNDTHSPSPSRLKPICQICWLTRSSAAVSVLSTLHLQGHPGSPWRGYCRVWFKCGAGRLPVVVWEAFPQDPTQWREFAGAMSLEVPGL